MADWSALVGRTFDGPAPCYGLVRAFYADVLGIDLPSYEGEVTSDEAAELARLIEGKLGDWREIDGPEFGDVVRTWMRHADQPSHVGIYLGAGQMLHAAASRPAVVDLLDSDFWRRRVVDYRRYAPPTWRLVAFPRPLSEERVELEVPVGLTVIDGLLRAGVVKDRDGYVRVLIGNEPVLDPAWWGRMRPKAGTLVSARSVPGDPVSITLALTAIGTALAAAVPGAGLVAGVVGASTFGLSIGVATAIEFGAVLLYTAAVVGGAAALSSLAAPNAPKAPRGAVGPQESPAAQGVGNDVRPFGPVPVLLGKMRVFPPFYARPFTEIVGRDRFWRLGLVVSAYRCKIDHSDSRETSGRSGIEIGGVPIEDIPGAEWEIIEGGAAGDYEEEILDEDPAEEPRVPIAYWRLGDGSSPASNEIGGGPTLVQTGGATFGQASIVNRTAGNSVLLDGVDDVLATTTLPLSDLSGDWTIALWFRALSLPGSTREVILWVGDDSNGVGISVDEDRFVVIDVPGVSPSAGYKPKAVNLLEGPFSVVLRRKGGALEAFVDGSRSAVLTRTAPATPSARLSIGARWDGSAYERFFHGRVQEVALYDFALTDDEVHFQRVLGNAAAGIPVRRGPEISLLGDTVREVQVNELFQPPPSQEGEYVIGEWVTREIPGTADELSVDLFWPGGLWRLELVSQSAEQKTASVGIDIEYRVSGTTTWQKAAAVPLFGRVAESSDRKPEVYQILDGQTGTWGASGIGSATPDGQPAIKVSGSNSQSPILQGFRWRVPLARYEIRLRQFTTEGASNRAGDDDVPSYTGDFQLLTIRGIDRSEPPLRGANSDTWALVNMVLPVKEVGATVGQVSVLAHSIFRERVSSAWTAERLTRNAGSLALAVLQNRALNPRPLEDSSLDLTSWEGFTGRAESCDLYVDFEGNTFDLANQVLSGSFSSLGFREKWGVVEDRSGLSPVQLLTSRDMAGCKWTKRFPIMPDGVRAIYRDRLKSWEETEVLVFRDGETEDTAERYETTEIVGITDRTEVIAHVKKRLRLAEHRSEEFRGTVWLTHLNAKRGDLVRFQHQNALIGLRAGRVIAVTTGGGGTTVTSVRLDEKIPYISGTDYGSRWKYASGSSVVQQSQNIANQADASPVAAGGFFVGVDYVIDTTGTTDFTLIGASSSSPGTLFTATGAGTGTGTATPTAESRLVVFSSAVAIASAPSVGDLLVVGERTEETLECLVREMTHTSIDGIPAADVALIPYASAAVFAAVDEEPVYDPVVSTPGGVPAQRVPLAPTIVSIDSDERYLADTPGGFQSQIRILAMPRRGTGAYAASLQGRIRQVFGARIGPETFGPWVYGAQVDAFPAELLIGPVIDGAPYQCQARAISREGLSSEWSPPIQHIAIGQSSPPPDVTELRRDSDVILWDYQTGVRDLDGFLVRYRFGTAQSVSWSSATAAHAGIWRGSQFPVARLPAGRPLTVFVKAVDLGGRQSETPARLTTTLPSPLLNVVMTKDQRALGWPGTKVNCSVSAGDLVADATAGDDSQEAWHPDDSFPYLHPDDSTPAWGARALTFSYTFGFTPGAESVGRQLTLEWEHETDFSALFADYRELGPGLAWADDDSAPAWDDSDSVDAWDDWSGWRSWPGSLVLPVRKPYEFRVALAGSPVSTKLTQLRLISDVDDRRVYLNEVPISAAGSRLPLPEPFTEIRTVLASKQQIGGDTSVRAAIRDYQPFGPLIEILDSDGDLVASSAWDFEVIGY